MLQAQPTSRLLEHKGLLERTALQAHLMDRYLLLIFSSHKELRMSNAHLLQHFAHDLFASYRDIMVHNSLAINVHQYAPVPYSKGPRICN